MKLIGCADLHITSKSTKYRIDDDYLHTSLSKFIQIIRLANKYKCSIYCAGDIVDHYNVKHEVVTGIIGCLNRLEKDFFIVLGQHDVPFHNFDIKKSPIGTLLKAGKVKILGNTPKNGVTGMNFGVDELPEKSEMIVAHKQITENDPPPFLSNAISATDALKYFKDYKIIITGDYHQAFTKKKNGRLIVNCGSMMRKNIDQIDMTPCVWVIDTEKVTALKHKLKVRPSDKIFNFNLADREKAVDTKFSDDMQELIKTLKKQNKIPPISETLNRIMKEKKVNKSVRGIVKEHTQRGE
jgi:predicted phosphodiesterase